MTAHPQSREPVAAMRTVGLAKTFRLGFLRKRVVAVRDVSIRVEPGEIFGLLGPNGAGKTTTLKVLMGLVRPSAGRAEVLGQRIGALDAKRRLGYLPESPYFYDYLTARELLHFVGQLFDLSRRECRRRAGQLLERVGLEAAADHALRTYSKGMLQRAGLAQALINDPDLVVLDEPLTGLDPLGRKQLRELIADLRAEGKTVLLSSHILSDVEQLADRAAIVVRGRTVASGPLDQLIDARVVSTEVMIGGASEQLIEALERDGHRCRGLAGGLEVIVEGAKPADPVIDAARAAGATVLSVTPRKESLEDVVVRQATLADEAASNSGDSDRAGGG